MPRLPRKVRQEGMKAPPSKRKAPVEPITEPTRGLREQIRVRCPCCGMLPEDYRLLGGPYPLEVKLQVFGGSTPSSTGKMRDRRGVMDYTDKPELSEEWKEKLREKLQAALDMLGE